MARLGSHLVAATIAFLIAAGPVRAQQPAPGGSTQERAEKALKQGMEMILRALEYMVDSIPQYEAPEVLENGDIILRRKKRQEKKREEKNKSPDDSSST